MARVGWWEGQLTDMNTKQKLERIIARNPELKDVIRDYVHHAETRELLKKIVERDDSKIIIIGKDSERTARLFELASLINRGFIHITQVTTPDLLDAYVDEETPSLTTIVDDLVMIHDSRAYVPNKQKSNMIMQVMEQNTDIIYYYVGMYKSFATEHNELIAYAKDNGIKMITSDTVNKSSKEEI